MFTISWVVGHAELGGSAPRRDRGRAISMSHWHCYIFPAIGNVPFPKACDKIAGVNETGIDSGYKAKLRVDGWHQPRGRVLASPISWHG
jgi:hypothetical protein